MQLQGTLPGKLPHVLVVTNLTGVPSVSDREHVKHCVRDVLLDVQSAEVTVQGAVRQIASTSGTSNLASLTTGSMNNDGNVLEDGYEKGIDRDDVITEDGVRSGSGVNTTRFKVSSVARHGRSPSANQVVPYIREPVADSNPEIEDMSRALIPFFEIRFLQKRTLRFTREILSRHPHGGTPARHPSEEGSERSPSLSQGSSGAKQRESLHPEQHAQSRRSVGKYLQSTPNSGPEHREYRQDQSFRPGESISSRCSSDENSRRSPCLSQARYERQSSSTVPSHLRVPEASSEHVRSLPSIARDSSSHLGSVSDLRSSTLDSSSQSFLIKDLKGRTHKINFDNPEIRSVSYGTFPSLTCKDR